MMMLIRSRCKLYNTFFVSRESSRIYSSSSSSTEQAPVCFSDLEDSILSGYERTSVVPILNRWIQDGKPVTEPVLNRIISRLNKCSLYTHALQVSEWMGNKLGNDLSRETFSKRLKLISTVHGLEHAETFFKGIPDAKIGSKVYNTLLSCYAEHYSLDETEVIMNKMKKLRPTHFTICYNTMLKLYAQMGSRIEKMDRLMQEMTEKKISNNATLTIALNGHVVAGDIEGMEKLLMQMEVNPFVTVDWSVYATAARGYIKSGNIEKALATLKKAENSVRGERRRLAYESLQTMYAAIGKRDEVYRLWNNFKTLKKIPNSSYNSMLSSLVELNDIEGAEKIFQEWESGHTKFDCRIPNMMITAYSKCGLADKAKACMKMLRDNGKELDRSTWDRLTIACCIGNFMERAVQALKKCTSTGADPNRTLSACIKYLKVKGDVESALEILNLVKEDGHISATAYDGLVSYVHGETLDIEAFDLTKQDSKMDGSIQVRDE